MKIFLASDHTGYNVKEKVKHYLQDKAYDIVDCGAYTLDPQDDYPQFMHKAAQGVSENPIEYRGVLFGGSGQGEAMVANKSTGVRCALIYSLATPQQAINSEGEKTDEPLTVVRLTREHNGANMLSLGVRFLSEDDILRIVLYWLQLSDPTNERHLRRIKQIRALEE